LFATKIGLNWVSKRFNILLIRPKDLVTYAPSSSWPSANHAELQQMLDFSECCGTAHFCHGDVLFISPIDSKYEAIMFRICLIVNKFYETMSVGTTGNIIHLMSSPYDCRCQLSCQAIHVLGLFCNMKICYLQAS